MNVSALPSALPPERAPLIANLLPDQLGRLRGSLRITDVCDLPYAPDGLSYYYGVTPAEDKLLAVCGGTLYAGSPIDITVVPPQWDMEPVGGGFVIGKRVRSVHYNQETFFVQEDGIQPLRYDGIGLYQVGISAPSAAPIVLPVTPTTAPDQKTGVIRYYYSYIDSRLRESDLSPYAEIDYASFPNQAGLIVINYGNDPQVIGAYIYATVAGVITVKYRIATLLKSADQLQWEDNAPDATVRTGTQAKAEGTYEIPNPASVIAVHKRHIVLNDTTDPTLLQINNIDSPTQWSTVTTTNLDGIRLNIGTHQGAGINALLTVGTLLFVGTRQEVLNLWGDTPTGSTAFMLRSLQNTLGVLAPDSWIFCNNVMAGIMQDGNVWLSGGEDNFLFHELSQEISALLRRHSVEELERAVAEWSNNTYVLAVGDTGYAYSFTSKGWFLIRNLHTDPIFVELTNGNIINANAPDYALPQSSLNEAGGIAGIIGSGGSTPFAPVEETQV